MKSLSNRALLILDTIAKQTLANGGQGSWLPDITPGAGTGRGMGDYDSGSGTYLNIGGAGDARILRGLKERGLVDRRPTSPTPYCFLFVTPAGQQLVDVCRGRLTGIRIDLRREEDQRRAAVEVRRRQGGISCDDACPVP